MAPSLSTADAEFGDGEVLYEVNLAVAPHRIAEFDGWLAEHVDEMCGLPGFLGADITPVGDRDDGWAQRTVQYRVESRAALDRYFAEFAPRMRGDGLARFGDDFTASRRIEDLRPAPDAIACPNCGHAGMEHFCPGCGQSRLDYHTSFWRLLLDFLGDTFTFDSRLIHSLWPLIRRPGFLTNEIMGGRRARYIPPLRLYLFISFVFFALAAFSAATGTGHGKPVNVNFDGIEKLQQNVAPAGDGTAAKNAADDERSLAKLLVERAQEYGKNPSAFLQAFFRKLPLVMFLLLPIYALFLKVLYLGSGRYYMEHLVFAFHVHALTFLGILTLLIWSTWMAPALGVASSGWLYAGVIAYLMLYPFFAMRRVYGQGRFVTFLKYVCLGTAYSGVLGFGMVAALFAALLL